MSGDSPGLSSISNRSDELELVRGSGNGRFTSTHDGEGGSPASLGLLVLYKLRSGTCKYDGGGGGGDGDGAAADARLCFPLKICSEILGLSVRTVPQTGHVI